MSDYIPDSIATIDDQYGREYDKYPDSRTRLRSNPGPGLHPQRQHGPPITPVHMMPQSQRPNGSGYGEQPRTPMPRSSRDPGTPMLRNTPGPGTPMLRNTPAPGTPMMHSLPSPNTPRYRSPPSSGTPMQRSPAVSNSPTMQRSPAAEHPQMMRSPPQTRMRSPQTQNGPMPGAARFRELDSVEPTRYTQALTNVSYPASQAPSWIEPPAVPQQPGRTESSFFVPRHASTPAPQSRFNEAALAFPGGFREEAPSHFEEPPRHFEEPLQHSDEQPPSFGEHTEQFEPVSHFEGDESYRRDPSSFVEDSGYLGPSARYEEHGDETRSVNDQTVDFEEELIPASFSRSDGEHEEQMPGGVHQESRFSDGSSFRVHEVDPDRFNLSAKPKKGFVGGFFAPFRNIPRMWSSSRSGKSSSIQPPMSTTNPSRPTLPLNLPSYSDLHADDPTRPSNPIPETTGDFSRITDTTATSHSGPHTPDQSGMHEAAVADDPGPLPNPYDSSPMPLAQPNVASPEAVVLEQAEDYDAMTEEPSYDAQPDTLGTHINTIGKFVKDLAHLPWVGPRATVAYSPSDSRRAYPKKPPGQSWYVKENHEKLDLLAGPTQPPPRTRPRPRPAPQATRHGQEARRQRTGAGEAPQRMRSPISASSTGSLDAATAIRPTTTPASLTTHGGLVRLPSPGASSHGHGQHSYSYAYYSPRPLYVYPAQVAAGGAAGAAAGAAPESAVLPPVGYPSALPLAMPPVEGGSPQAVPVFMLAAPPQYPSPPLSASPRRHRRHHSSRRRHEQKASSSSPPPPMPMPPAANAP